LVRARVDVQGAVREAQISKSSGELDLDRAASDAVKSCRFLPGLRGARPAESWVNVPIRFRLDAR